MRKVCACQARSPPSDFWMMWYDRDWGKRRGLGRWGCTVGLPKILSAIIHNEVQSDDRLWQQQWWNDISSVHLTSLEVVDWKDVSFAYFCRLFHFFEADAVQHCVQTLYILMSSFFLCMSHKYFTFYFHLIVRLNIIFFNQRNYTKH